MKYVLLSFFSMLLGFTGIYIGLLTTDYIDRDGNAAQDSNIATLTTSEISYQSPNFIERVEAQDEKKDVEGNMPASTSVSTAGTDISDYEASSTEDVQIDILPITPSFTAQAKENLEPEKAVLEEPTREIKPMVQKTKETILKVPLFIQEFKNSCEAASLRMALAYKNIQTSGDMELIQKFGYSPVRKDVTNNVWSDPQNEFVGFVDEQCSECGYGVYGIPVTKTARSYGLDAVYLTDIVPSVLAEELFQNNPIITWGYTSLSAPYTWKTSAGTIVKAFKGTHSRVLTGFKGEKENPIGFYISDPLSGKKNEYWSTAKLVAHMNAVPGVTNQIVVVK